MMRVWIMWSRGGRGVGGSIRWHRLVVMVVMWLVVGVVGCLVRNVDRVGNFNLDMLLADVLDLFMALLLVFNVFHRLVLRLTSELDYQDTVFHSNLPFFQIVGALLPWHFLCYCLAALVQLQHRICIKIFIKSIRSWYEQ